MADRTINRRDGGLEDGKGFYPLVSPRQAKPPVERTVEIYLGVLSKTATTTIYNLTDYKIFLLAQEFSILSIIQRVDK